MPSCHIHGQYRFNRAELLDWATARKIHVPSEILSDPDDNSSRLPALADALQAGGVFHDIRGSDKESLLGAVVAVMPLPAEVDRELLLGMLLAREALQSTGIGDGIAIPHVRNPIVLHVPRPAVTLCFPSKPVEFAALDGKPVHVLFTVVSSTVRVHLHLLARLAFALRHEGFRKAVMRHAAEAPIFEAAREAEERFRAAPPIPERGHR